MHDDTDGTGQVGYTPVPPADGTAQERVISLDGPWTAVPEPETDFWTAETVDSGTSVTIPCELAAEGMDVDPETVVGLRRRVQIPAGWEDQRILLRFDGVYSHAVVRVDGERVGAHSGGFTPFELDVSEAVEPGGSHVLGVAVSADDVADDLASGNRYAGHSLTGITRPVRLFTVPGCHLSDFEVQTTFDDAFEDATLTCTVSVRNDGATPHSPDVTLSLRDPDGDLVELPTQEWSLPTVAPGETVEETISVPASNPVKWHPERPACYRLTCAVDGVPTVRRRVGFREVAVDGDGLVLNGESLTLRGVCRHEIHPVHGRAVPPEVARTDAARFRACNANFVRAVHYPPTEAFLDACDELGLLVEVEAPFSWVGQADHADAAYATDPDLSAHVVGPTVETVEAHRHHPSVALWSLANESVWGENFARAAEAVRERDDRPLVFNYIDYDDADANYCELGVHHYPGPEGLAAVDDPTRPVLFDEYCHLDTYNRRELATDPGLRDYWGRGFARMWERMESTDGVAGGALWSGIDEVFALPGADPYVGYGEWGVVDGWRRPKPEHWHVKKTYSPLSVDTETVSIKPGERPAVTLDNEMQVLDLADCRVTWSLGSASGTCNPSVPPSEQGEIVPDVTPETDGTLSLTVSHPDGYVIDEFAVDVETGQESTARPTRGRDVDPTPLSVTETAEAVIVGAGSVEWTVDRATGHLQGIGADGHPILQDGPWVTITPLQDDVGSYFEEPPAPLSGDSGSAPDTHPLEGVLTSWTATDVTVTSTTPPTVSVTGTTPAVEAALTYEFAPDGGLSIAYEFTALESLAPREVGLTFDLDPACQRLEWNRDGQWSTYPPTHVGRTAGWADAFGDAEPTERRTRPTRPWAADRTAAGSNDFRSTKYDVRRATLCDPDGHGLRVVPDGTAQHVRARVDEECTQLLVAAHSNGGADPFFGPHVAADRRSLSLGDSVAARLDLSLE